MMRLHIALMGVFVTTQQTKPNFWSQSEKSYPIMSICVSPDYDDAAASEPHLPFSSIIASSSASFSESNIPTVSGSVHNFLRSFAFIQESICSLVPDYIIVRTRSMDVETPTPSSRSWVSSPWLGVFLFIWGCAACILGSNIPSCLYRTQPLLLCGPSPRWTPWLWLFQQLSDMRSSTTFVGCVPTTVVAVSEVNAESYFSSYTSIQA